MDLTVMREAILGELRKVVAGAKESTKADLETYYQAIADDTVRYLEALRQGNPTAEGMLHHCVAQAKAVAALILQRESNRIAWALEDILRFFLAVVGQTIIAGVGKVPVP